MKNCACAGIPTGVVPHNAKASDTIEVEILEIEIAENKIITVQFALRMLIGYRH